MKQSIFLLLLWAPLSLCFKIAQAEQTVFTIDAKNYKGSVSLNGDSIGIANKTFPISQVIRIDFESPFQNNNIKYQRLILQDGSILAGVVKTYDKGKQILTYELITGGILALNTKDIRRIHYKNPRTIPAKATAPGTYITMLNGKQLKGEIDYLTPTLMGFKSGGDRRRLKNQTIADIQFIKKTTTQKVKKHIMWSRYGDRICGQLKSITKDRINFSHSLKQFSLDKKHVQCIEFLDERFKSLSNTKPDKIQETPFLDSILSPRFNESLFGSPPVIGLNFYDKGISLQSKTTLTYKIEGQYQAMSMMIGMDTVLSDRGEAKLIIQGDKKVLQQEDIKANTLKPLIIPLSGVKNLTITLDYGKFGSSADFALLTDPYLIKSDTTTTKTINEEKEANADEVK